MNHDIIISKTFVCVGASIKPKYALRFALGTDVFENTNKSRPKKYRHIPIQMYRMLGLPVTETLLEKTRWAFEVQFVFYFQVTREDNK